MANLNQDPQMASNPEQEINPPMDRFALLRLNSFKNSSYAAAAAAADHCMKRRSPSSPSSLPDSTTTTDSEPKLKKHFIQPDDTNLCGFSKISLPIEFGSKTKSRPVLRRSFSDPCKRPAASNGGSDSSFNLPASPESATMSASLATPSPSKSNEFPSSLPPLPPSIFRSVSDLTPAKNVSRSPCSCGTPNSERLTRMKERMRAMKQWQNRNCSESEPEPESECINKNAKKDECETEVEECVSVEKIKECVILNFKCPCNKEYQILLHRNNCYYKLM